MVLESLLRTKDARERPELIVVMALIATSVAIILSYIAFGSESSMLWIAFVTITMIPFMVKFFKEEENHADTDDHDSASSFLDRNAAIIKLYVLYFFGIIIATALWYLILPSDVSDVVFANQNETVNSVRILSQTLNNATGNFLAVGSGGFWTNFDVIFWNNMWVLFLVLVTSFLYGAGALFIITWNASVIGVFMGGTMQQLSTTLYANVAFGNAIAFGHGFYASLGFLPHGIFEIVAYSLVAIGGSILSASFVDRDKHKGEVAHIIKDSIWLTILAVVVLAVGALIESGAI